MHKIAIIFLSISLNMCFGYSKEPSHQDGSFKYPQHMFWLRNNKNNFQVRTFIWGPAINREAIYIHFVYIFNKNCITIFTQAI